VGFDEGSGASAATGFDEVIDRSGTDAAAWEAFGSAVADGALPLWVADMGFRSPAPVQAALLERIEHGIYGYPLAGAQFRAGVAHWLAQRHNWVIDPDWVVELNGVVPALHVAIETCTAAGDGVAILQPVYPPFEAVVRHCGRELLVSQLVQTPGGYEIDFDDLERQLVRARALILCSPHNPVGRVWTLAELERVGELCVRHGVTVISDEIHQDFVYAPARHRPFPSVCPDPAGTICLGAPSKTFNTAGLNTGWAVIADPEQRRTFTKKWHQADQSGPSALGLVACTAAYTGAAAWVDALIEYLDGNRRLIGEFLDKQLPQIKLTPAQGTYLAWLDCRDLGIDPLELNRAMRDRAKLILSDGRDFGQGGSGFQRLNYAMPRPIIEDALARLAEAFAH
jgi:cystathionine beta-lyase